MRYFTSYLEGQVYMRDMFSLPVIIAK